MVVEPGFPKPLASEFPGLTGTISATLAVPATRSSLETVYFFKNGEERQIVPVKHKKTVRERSGHGSNNKSVILHILYIQGGQESGFNIKINT